MWGKQILLGILGLSAGMGTAAGLFSFIIGLGVVSDFADRTHTGEKILWYEDCIAAGGILGNLFWVYQIWIPGGRCLLSVFGLFSGIFVGCWSMALAEVLNIFPIDKVYSVSDSGDGTRKRNRSNLVFLHEMVKKNVVGGCK